VTALLERLPTTPLLVVAGPSGCGKSSLVRAGLVPALRHRGRATAVFVPGSDPEAALADASASVESDAVLVVDQFEELYALGRPRDVVRAFCLRIAEHARDRAPVVIVVRSDHLGGLGTDPAFSRLVEQGLHLVSPLDGDALREAIEQPAALAPSRSPPATAWRSGTSSPRTWPRPRAAWRAVTSRRPSGRRTSPTWATTGPAARSTRIRPDGSSPEEWSWAT
jgi:hypothetical protein